MTENVALHALVKVKQLDREGLQRVFYEMGDVLTELSEEVDAILDHALAVDLGQSLLEITVTAAGRDEADADLAARTAVLVAMLRSGGTLEGGEGALRDWLLEGRGSPETVDAQLESAGVVVTRRELLPA